MQVSLEFLGIQLPDNLVLNNIVRKPHRFFAYFLGDGFEIRDKKRRNKMLCLCNKLLGRDTRCAALFVLLIYPRVDPLDPGMPLLHRFFLTACY